MPTVLELLKSAGIADDVAAGLPKEVVTALTGYVADADTKLQTAATESTKAEEARRQAELERQEINNYVENYGTSLTKMASVEAKNQALVSYIKTLKDKGFDIPVELMAGDPAAKPVVPGSPAVGGNVFDPVKFRGEVGVVMSEFLDSNNEHIRLYGTPIPDNSTALAEEATRARKPIGQYIGEKYGFATKRKENETAAFNKRVDDRAKEIDADRQRRIAEETGSNPNLRTGESSRNSFVPKLKRDEFHKADGFAPERTRKVRMLDKIHEEVAAAQSA